MESTQSRLVKGLFAGMVAGLVATAAKTIIKRYYPPQAQGEKLEGTALVQRFAGHLLGGGAKSAASEPIEWGFGALTGAAYGALAEFYPSATAEKGAGFGMAMLALTHEGPALLGSGGGSAAEQVHGAEAASFALYGVVTERVRSIVRRIL
jgi:putative membrane protein